MKWLMILIMGVFIMGLASAENFGYTIYDAPTVATNYSTVNVNNSDTTDTWITTEGTLDDVSDISHSWLSDLLWSVAGHIIDTDFLPDSSLAYDLGSGALRWDWLYVRNISAESIDTFNLDADTVNVAGNITAKSGTFTGQAGYDEKLGYANARIGGDPWYLSGRLILEYFQPGLNTIWQIDNGGNGIRFFDDSDVYASINESGIDTDFNLDVAGNWTGNSYYAEGWYHNHTATALSFASASTFYNLTIDNFKLNGFTGDSTNHLLTPLVAGLYKATFSAGGSGENNHEYVTTILIKGVTQENCEVHKKMSAGGDITTMNGDCFIDLGVGDYVQVGTQDYGDTSSGNFYSSNLNLVRIGD